MTFTRGSLVLVVLIAPFVYGVSPVAAQRPRPGESLYGADRAPDPSGRSVDVTVAVSRARDDDLGADEGAASAIDQRVGGSYSDVSVLAAIRLPQRRVSFDTRAYSLLRHYSALSNYTGSSFSAETNVTIALGSKTFVRASADANSVSNFAFDIFNRQARFNQDRSSSTEPGASTADRHMVFDWTSQSYGASANLTRTLGRRHSFSVMTGARRIDQPVLEGRTRTRESVVMAQLREHVGHDTFVQIDYSLRKGVQQQIGHRIPFVTHDILGRVERQWQHSRVRRTAISLAGGPSFLQQQTRDTGIVATVPLDAEPNARMWRAVGIVTLVHDLSNRWNVETSVRRGAGLGQTGIFSNTAALGLRGSLGPRVRVDLRAGYTDGDIGFVASRNRDETSYAATQLQVALSRSAAVYGQYFLYHYRFALAGGRLNRGGFRVGMSFWAPLWRAVTA